MRFGSLLPGDYFALPGETGPSALLKVTPEGNTYQAVVCVDGELTAAGKPFPPLKEGREVVGIVIPGLS